MDPKMMEFAMEQMRRMSPQQMQSMMSTMGNVNPAMMQMAMQQMQNISPAEMEQARQKMNSMDPEAIANQAKEASTMMSARQQYVVNGSKLLKADGNRLHTAGKYAEAAEKYERARTNLTDISRSAEAADLLKACTLNLGSCYLQLGRFHDAISACDDILKSDPQNVKALYRRGQAYAALHQHEAAVSDLQASLALSAHDPQQQQLIREKLEALPGSTQAAGQPQQPAQPGKQQIGDPGQPVPLAMTAGDAAVGAARAGVADDHEDGLIEEVVEGDDASLPEPPMQSQQQKQQQEPQVPNVTQQQAPLENTNTTGAPWAGSNLPQQMQQAAEMMRQNPEMMRQAAEMMKSMTPAQIAAMSQQAGTPLDVDSIAQAQRHMAALTPDQMDSIAKLNSLGPSALSHPEAREQAAKMMQDPQMMKAAANMMQSMPKEQLQAMIAQAGMPAGMNLTPEMLSMASDQLSRLSPEQLQAMAAMASSQASLGPVSGTAGAAAADISRTGVGSSGSSSIPAGPAAAAARLPGAAVPSAAAPDLTAMMTPEMMQAASNMMANMKQEDLEAMQQMLGGGGPAGAAGGPAGLTPDMMSAAMSPGMMEGMMNMMQGMDEATLAQMMAGMMGGDQQKAALVAKQLKQMSPTQLRLMTKAAALAQAGAQRAHQAKEWLASRQVLVVAVVVLLLAVLLRWYGIL